MSYTRRRKWENLLDLLRPHRRLLIAFSGGADSTLLLVAACEAVGVPNVLAVTAISASLPTRDKTSTRALAATLGARYQALDTEELSNPDYASNPSNRCFFCKDELFTKLAPLAQSENMTVADGFNVSDRSDYRPGFQAAQKWNVIHPLDAANLDKRDIRTLSRWKKLPTWNKPASPCLSSRIPYGRPVTEEKLRQIELAEMILHDAGFRVARVRHYEHDARIEVPFVQIPVLLDPEKWEKIQKSILACGFERVDVDPRGFQSGRLNAPTEKDFTTLVK